MRLLKIILVLMMVNTGGTTWSQTTSYKWYKGNTHTHTTMSDGDSTPGLVARWYRNNGYDFLMLTDHNTRTEIAEIQAEIDQENALDKRKKFLLIPGEEVSSNFSAEDRKLAVHLCGIDTRTTIGKQKADTLHKLLQKSVDAIAAAGGMPSVNHPNFLWSLTTDDLYHLKHVKHYEIYNGHPKVNNLGGGGVPGTEEIWDDLLTRGKKYFGVAVDDAHHYKEFRKDLSNPGRGWVVVKANENSVKAIRRGLEAGDFYASNGVVLDDVWTTPSKGVALAISHRSDIKYTTHFIGRDGKILKTDTSFTPHYELQPDDLYVRARVTASTGDQAWTQPIYVTEPTDPDASSSSPSDITPEHTHPHSDGT